MIAGRSRKVGRRKPSGRLGQPSRAAAEAEAKRVVRSQRWLHKRLSEMDAPELGGSIGTAWARGIINGQQYEAAVEWERRVRQFAAATGIGIAPRGIAALDRVPGTGAQSDIPPEGTPARRRYDNAVRAAHKRYDIGFGALACAGLGVAREVNRVVIWDEPVASPADLRKGLDALAAEFGTPQSGT